MLAADLRIMQEHLNPVPYRPIT